MPTRPRGAWPMHVCFARPPDCRSSATNKRVMLNAGQQLELDIEKPAAGGRMIARHEGQVVLVLGAIPGERVLARIDKADRQLAFASTLGVISASPDRREPFVDPLCGGCLYAHVSYPRQLRIKA